MAEERRGPSKFWIGIGILPVLGICGMAYVSMLKTRRWGDASRRTNELIAEARSRTGARPVLRGQAIPGNAWSEYNPILSDLNAASKADPGFFADLPAWASRKTADPKWDRIKVEEIVRKQGHLVDRLSHAVQHTEGSYPWVWEDCATGGPSLIYASRLGELAVVKAKWLKESGNTFAAAQLLLDVGQFAHDMAQNSFMIQRTVGTSFLKLMTEDLGEILKSGKLTPSEAAEVARELQILDQFFPRSRENLLNDSIATAVYASQPDFTFGSYRMLGLEDERASWPDTWGSWRYGFSMRLEIAEGLLQWDDIMSRLPHISEGSWAEVQSLTAEIGKEIASSRNRLVRLTVPSIKSFEAGVRQRRAQLRILRVAAHFQATGEVLPLDDPYGSKLRTARDGGKLKVWSVGSDGVDNGGVGGWNSRDPGTDIVFEIGS